MKKINFTSVFLLLAGFSLTIAAQSSFKVAEAGVGFDGLRIGKSTRADVIRKYGRGFKAIKHGSYSAQMKYEDGMSFYYCQKDRQQEIFDIELRAPAKVKTAQGLVLSHSTVNDIYEKYGKPIKGLRYKGIEFYYAKYRGKKVITVIDIVEKSGMRQCKE